MQLIIKAYREIQDPSNFQFQFQFQFLHTTLCQPNGREWNRKRKNYFRTTHHSIFAERIRHAGQHTQRIFRCDYTSFY